MLEVVMPFVEWGAAIVGGLIATKVAASTIVFVKEKTEVVIESFGKYSRTMKNAGIQLKQPWPFQTAAHKVSMAMTQLEEPLQTKTKDDMFVSLPIKMHLQVIDTKKYVYESTNAEEQIKTRVAATVKQHTANMNFADLYQARVTVSEAVRKDVGPEIEQLYGMRLVDVIVDEPHAPEEIRSAFNNVKASERNMLASKNTAEAAKIAMIADAEGRREALRLDGEGQALQRTAIFEKYGEQFNALAAKGMTKEQAQEVVLEAMRLDTYREISKHGNVFMLGNGQQGQNNITDLVTALKIAAKDAPEAP